MYVKMRFGLCGTNLV